MDGKDLRSLPLVRRKRALQKVLCDQHGALAGVHGRGARTRDLFAAAARLDLEGIVAKRKADPHGPSTCWYNIKNRAYTQGEGRWELFQKRR